MDIINKKLLDKITIKAINCSRLRMNYNFHEQLDAPSQRLLNALEPGTELPIHRHMYTGETYILLRGKIKVIFYSENKVEKGSVVLNPLEGNSGINIPAGTWHTLEVLESGSVIFECKDGPYTPLTDEDILQ